VLAPLTRNASSGHRATMSPTLLWYRLSSDIAATSAADAQGTPKKQIAGSSAGWFRTFLGGQNRTRVGLLLQ
jgi:hypothetical protein